MIGGGQSALATGYYLARSRLRFAMLDEQLSPGGAWQHFWTSLRAFSPAQWSSLPGWLMPRAPGSGGDYPSRDEVVSYLAEYERRYSLPVRRGVRVTSVTLASSSPGSALLVHTSHGTLETRALVSATGGKPYLPEVAGSQSYTGRQLHSFDYSDASEFAAQNVVVVGAGNSGAQIVADLTEPVTSVGRVTWATLEPPVFLPDDVDGRYLFEQATLRYKAMMEGRTPPAPASLGDVVMVAPVKAARERGDLESVRMFVRMTHTGVVWPDGRETAEDGVIWATGFKPNLHHLAELGIVRENGLVDVGGNAETRATSLPQIWLVGYGNWTGFASATLVGVGRSARATVEEIVQFVQLQTS